MQDARRLTKRNAAGTQQYALAVGYGIGMFYPLVFAQGGTVWKDAEKREIQLASEPFLKAAEFYKRNLVEPGYIPRPETVTERGGVVKMFYNGEAAILFDGTHRAFTLKEAPDVDWVAVPFLGFGGTKKTTAGFPYWAVCPRASCRRRLPHALSHAEREGPIKYWQLLWVAPPANRSAVKSPAFKQVPGMPGHIPALKDEREWQDKCAWTAWCLDRSDLIETEHISRWGPIIGTETGARVARIFAQTDTVQAKPALEEAVAAINGYIKQNT